MHEGERMMIPQYFWWRGWVRYRDEGQVNGAQCNQGRT